MQMENPEGTFVFELSENEIVSVSDKESTRIHRGQRVVSTGIYSRVPRGTIGTVMGIGRPSVPYPHWDKEAFIFVLWSTSDIQLMMMFDEIRPYCGPEETVH